MPLFLCHEECLELEYCLNRIQRILDRLIVEYYRAGFKRAIRGVLGTPPMKEGSEPFITLSMVQHRDVLAYLLAVKTFATRLASARIVVVCDPSITDEDKTIMKAHVPFIEFRQATEFHQPGLPVGGTWERLTAICEYAKNSYVIQLDADTVTLGDIPEVAQCVATRRSFVLGERANQGTVSLAEATEYVKDWSDQHIQAAAEKVIASVLDPTLRYVRGCSGFTGFPVNDKMHEDMLVFSYKMEEMLGKRWHEWGTEQITSNYLAANLEALVLPYPKYSAPERDHRLAIFRHYIGSIRFKNDRYAADARRLISELQCAPT